jgi:ribosome biogenesis protein SLX9
MNSSLNVCGAYCFRSYYLLTFFSRPLLLAIFDSSLTRLVSSRLPLRRSIIVSGLEASRTPYSKSHARRLKRKERERLAGSGMESLKTALPSITSSKSAGEDPGGMTTSAKSTAATSTGPSAESECAPAPDTEAPSPPTPRLGQIGQGKGTPLTRSQRRRALCVYFFFHL